MVEFFCDKTNLYFKWNQLILGKTLVTQISHSQINLSPHPSTQHIHIPMASTLFSTAEWEFHTAKYLTKYFNHWLSGGNLKPRLTDTQLSDRTEAIIYKFRLKTKLNDQFCLKYPVMGREGKKGSFWLHYSHNCLNTHLTLSGITDTQNLAS
jgi:hypothetical protein